MEEISHEPKDEEQLIHLRNGTNGLPVRALDTGASPWVVCYMGSAIRSYVYIGWGNLPLESIPDNYTLLNQYIDTPFSQHFYQISKYPNIQQIPYRILSRITPLSLQYQLNGKFHVQVGIYILLIMFIHSPLRIAAGLAV